VTIRSNSTAAATATATYNQSIHQPFPSIVIGPERSIEPQGSFAEAQAQVRHKKINRPRGGGEREGFGRNCMYSFCVYCV
jgi:hypothetical protein